VGAFVGHLFSIAIYNQKQGNTVLKRYITFVMNKSPLQDNSFGDEG
jgi:hypothetical protein